MKNEQELKNLQEAALFVEKQSIMMRKEAIKENRRERIATALMSNLMREDMTDCDMRDYVELAIEGADALIKALDEVKE